jgi:methylenetetrahydrofolate dehydrogenase (NADP+)/methenyltetrahydrofolate cyclohydrolase
LERRGFSVLIENAPRRIPEETKKADIIVVALGRGPRLGAQHIRRGAIIIDVGIRHQRGKTVGDVAQSAWSKAKAISPVPGGVGPLTVSSVLLNTYRLAGI